MDEAWRHRLKTDQTLFNWARELSMAQSVENMNAAVRVLQQTVDHWDVAEEDLPLALKFQAD